MTIETIAAKIAKLIAKADSSTHPAEADTFMSKAQELMMAHGLSLLDLGRLDQDDAVGTDRNVLHSYRADPWAKLVIPMLATYYGCEAVCHSFKGTGPGTNKLTYSLVGRESARVTTQLMAPFVLRQVRRLAKEQAAQFSTEAKARTMIGNALALRIHRMNAERRRDEPVGTGLNALVPVDMIKLEMEAQFPNMTEGKDRKVKTNAAAQAAANRVSLNAQATAAPAARRIA